MLENKFVEQSEAERTAVYKKWAADPMVASFAAPHDARVNLAVLLENTKTAEAKSDNDFFRTYGRRITGLAYRNMKSPALVGFQPVLDTCDTQSMFGYLDRDGEVKSEKCQLADHVRKVTTQGWSSIDERFASDYADVIGMEIALELDRLAVSAMMRHAGTTGSWSWADALGDTIMEKYESLYCKLIELSSIVEKKCNKAPNFIVTSPEVASIFETATAAGSFEPTMSDTFTGSLGIQYVGTISQRWRLFKDPLFQPDKLLMGYSTPGDRFDAGLFFMPQHLFDVVGDDNQGTRSVVSRHSMRFAGPGKDCYANLKIVGFVY